MLSKLLPINFYLIYRLKNENFLNYFLIDISDGFLKKIFYYINDYVRDDPERCTTGLINCIVYSLNGLHEKVNIEITDAENASNIVCHFLAKNSTFTVDEKRTQVKLILTEKGYSSKIIEDWVSSIE